MQVKHSHNGTAHSGDRLVGRTGIKVCGLQGGLPLRVDLGLYGGSARAAGGGCLGCFGGGDGGEEELDTEGPAVARPPSHGDVRSNRWAGRGSGSVDMCKSPAPLFCGRAAVVARGRHGNRGVGGGL